MSVCIYIYIHSEVMKTIHCTHSPHHHNDFVTRYRLWMASGEVIVVKRRMSALDCFRDFTMYVLRSFLCAC